MLTLALSATVLLSGCGAKQQQQAAGATQVKAMKVLQQDAPVSSEYAGQIVGRDEVKVQSKVSGKIVEKYFHGGDHVEAGQPLYRLDSRQYESAVLQAQANLAQSQATLSNAQTDLYRRRCRCRHVCHGRQHESRDHRYDRPCLRAVQYLGGRVSEIPQHPAHAERFGQSA